MRSGFRSLRTQFVFPTVREAISKAARVSEGFRVVEFSVQGNHVHLIVEAADRRALSAGMRGLAVRIARRVNRLVFRRGRFWADRWHGRALASPRAVRHALVYVLANFKKHGAAAAGARLDPYSSAPYFGFFVEFAGAAPVAVKPNVIPRSLAPPHTPPALPAKTWLLRRGWRERHGELSVNDAPR